MSLAALLSGLMREMGLQGVIRRQGPCRTCTVSVQGRALNCARARSIASSTSIGTDIRLWVSDYYLREPLGPASSMSPLSSTPMPAAYTIGLGEVEPDSSRMPAQSSRLPLEQALHARRPVHRGGLIHQQRMRGSQYVSDQIYRCILAEAGLSQPSVGSVRRLLMLPSASGRDASMVFTGSRGHSPPRAVALIARPSSVG